MLTPGEMRQKVRYISEKEVETESTDGEAIPLEKVPLNMDRSTSHPDL